MLQIDGYHFGRLDRDEKGGGVGCFIQKNISYIRRLDLEDRELEIMWLEIRQHNHKSKYLVVVYRPPNSRSVFFNNLEMNLENICMLSNDIVILGDLNCNMLTQNNLSNQINELSDNMHLSQLIRDPTRITVNSTTLIDLILVSFNLKSLESGTQSIGLSDHFIDLPCIERKTTISICSVSTYRSFRNFKVDIH